ncbi:hypothetical protein M0R72_17655 [Candidatus Pacearchaeota archaeon]|jgi:hypothetical protein|nr:hypothetical protein [Candidatus Pacearchaeota archaeon]
MTTHDQFDEDLEDLVISFQEATTGLPVTGKYRDHEYGWQFTLDGCADEWAYAVAPPIEAQANLEYAESECKRLTKLLKGIRDIKRAVTLVRKEGHSAEVI